MDELEQLRPTRRHRIYDLVAAAGVNVEDWGNYKSGPAKASQNPKYCYEWAFMEPSKLVVLCLWFDNLQVTEGSFFQEPNPRAYAESIQNRKPRPGTVIGRARRMDERIATAYEQRLPIKIIICDGRQRDREDSNSKASSVSGRMLDPVPWAVTAYDPATGNCIVARGATTVEVFDQFSVPIDPARKGNRHTETYIRDRSHRDAALRRACGHCEYCGKIGFETEVGYAYLETHHVVPLSEGGADHEKNIVALCANDHRAAHYAKNRAAIREELERVLSRYYA